jgi:hypothetical protein
MKDYEIKYNELIDKYPHLEPTLKQNNDAFKDFKNIENELIESYLTLTFKKLELLITTFDISLSGSINQTLLIKSEIENIESVLNSGFLINDFVHSYWTDLFEIDLIKTKNIYHKLIRGLEIELLLNIDEQIEYDYNDLINTKVLTSFKDVLYSLLIPIEKTKETLNNNETIESIEPKNPHKRIFVNGYSFEFFERLRAEIMNNDKFIYADYSFIMQKMINDNYLVETNHLKLIRFLDKNYNTTIEKNYIQFKFSNANAKTKTYSRLNKEFKPKINSVL